MRILSATSSRIWAIILSITATSLFLGGCGSAPPPAAAMRMPVIRPRVEYPDNMTAEQFWMDMGAFYRKTEERRMMAGLTETEEEMIERLYAVEMIRRAAEAEIREYNKQARDWNRRHGFKN